MAVLEDALIAIAKADLGVNGMIGAGGKIRMWPLTLDHAGTGNPTLPATVYQRISTTAIRTHENKTGDHTQRMQFSHWADTFTQCRLLAEAFRAMLEGYKGTVLGVVIKDVSLGNDLDQDDPGTKRYRAIQDYMITYG